MKKIIYLALIALILLFNSCENEPVDIFTVSEEDVINVDSNLFRTLVTIADEEPKNVTACIEFVYNFTVIVYNSNLEIIDFEIMHSDSEFILFLMAIAEENSISISYPIKSTLENGEELIINNNAELQENLKKCLEEETVNYCNGLLEECIWKVIENEGTSLDFIDSYYDSSNIGTTWFHFEEEIILGTWVSLYIENELHLNINLNDTTEVAENWNLDWKATIYDENHMFLENDSSSFLLEKECFSPCKQIVFEECEFEEGSEIAIFQLESYINCFLPYTTLEDVSNYTITFHQTIDDALEGLNPLNSESYTNTENPQEIYVRIIENETGGILPVLTIYLVAVSCF